MKKLILAGIVTLGLSLGFAYAENKAATELEHQIGTANDAESVGNDMSAMKAAGKCNADQTGKKKVATKKSTKPKGKAATELEHQNKLKTGDDSAAGDMGNMKRCGSD